MTLDKLGARILAFYAREADGVLAEDESLDREGTEVEMKRIEQKTEELLDEGLLRFSPALGHAVITKTGRDLLEETLPEVSMRPRAMPKKGDLKAEMTAQITNEDFQKMSPRERDTFYESAWRNHLARKKS